MTNLLHKPSVLNELNQLFNQNWSLEGDLSSAATSNFIPAVDIKETDKLYTILVDVPGVNPQEIHINMENAILTIHGEKSSEKTTEKDSYSRTERVSGSFYRRFSLPDTADAESISAKTKHGVLEISIPKTAHSQPRKITVNVEN
jgi:HSP20 family protein